MTKIPLVNIELTDTSDKVIIKRGTLNIQQHYIDATSMDSGGYVEYIPSGRTWWIEIDTALPTWAESAGRLHFSSGRRTGDCIAEGSFRLKGLGALTTE